LPPRSFQDCTPSPGAFGKYDLFPGNSTEWDANGVRDSYAFMQMCALFVAMFLGLRETKTCGSPYYMTGEEICALAYSFLRRTPRQKSILNLKCVSHNPSENSYMVAFLRQSRRAHCSLLKEQCSFSAHIN